MRVIHRCGLYTEFKNNFLHFQEVRVIHRCGLYTGNYGTCHEYPVMDHSCISRRINTYKRSLLVFVESQISLRIDRDVYGYISLHRYRKIYYQRYHLNKITMEIRQITGVIDPYEYYQTRCFINGLEWMNGLVLKI